VTTTTENTHVFGPTVRTKHKEIWLRHARTVHAFFTPLIEVDGKWVYIADASTESQMIERQTRAQAKKAGLDVLAQIWVHDNLDVGAKAAEEMEAAK
jgi:hypothetical protein